MVSFPCFPIHIHHCRSKKFVQQSDEEMDTTIQNSAAKASTLSASSNHLNSNEETSPSSYECCCKSQDPKCNSCTEDNKETFQDDEKDQGLSLGDSQDKKTKRAVDSFGETGSAELYDHGDPGINFQSYEVASYSHNMLLTPDLFGKGSFCQADLGKECLLSSPIEGCHEKFKCEIQSGDDYDSPKNTSSVNNWREPEMDGLCIGENLKQKSSIQNLDEINFRGFNIERVEEWISRIDFEDGIHVQELGESSNSGRKKDSHMVGCMTPLKLDAITSPGMEVAYSYISSLTSTSSSAQMANLGLVVIPFMSTLINLRDLNLSGNAIVRITAGVLPRGLRILNLSRNNISIIEGLRDLTRLRVLDLSYNRIFRIGHGLASCTSLKELYFAGNKINEVEGLHRLKLNILDLRFNKISTAKCLGQLAANYATLQAINLEGNPAQRNEGHEQLQKFLSTLLPHLLYFNREPIRARPSKELSYRPARSVCQMDSCIRSEHKHFSRRTHGAVTRKSKASSNHRQCGHAMSNSLKQSTNRHGSMVPTSTGSKATHHLRSSGTELFSLQPSYPMQRSRSTGALEIR